MEKRLFKIVLIGFVLFTNIKAFSQQRVLSGHITDNNNNSLPGVTVTIESTNTATVSDGNGHYSIQAPKDGIIVFSSVGFEEIKRAIPEGNTLDIVLTPLFSNLKDVVVIGYGSTLKEDLTGSVSTVTAKDFQDGSLSTPEQLIMGKVPGVSIISNGGQPGQGSTIRIRGGSSLNASNSPLIVIDGVPLDNGGISGSSNQLSMINPDEIESFTVLKDASAAAIYGTRGSNGVIIITTKKGTSGKLKVNLSTLNSLSKITGKVKILDADQFRSIVNENGSQEQIDMLGKDNTDWQDVIYQTAFTTQNNVTLSGGLANLPYRLSLGYLNQQGVLKTDRLERATIGIALNPVLFDNHLKINLNLKGTAEWTQFANQGAIGGAISFDPTHPVFSNSDRFGGYYEWLDPTSTTGLSDLQGRNPLGLLEQTFDRSQPKRSIGNIQFDYKFHFLPDLRANLNLGYDVADGRGTVFVSDSAASAYLEGGKGGSNNFYKQVRQNSLLEFYLNYVKEISSIKSKIDAMAGYSYNNFQTQIFNYPSYYADKTKQPNSDPTFPFDIPEHTLLSYFGRLNFTVNDRYLLTATVRRDGSSRFGAGNKWGTFPSLALAWKLKEENMLKNSSSVSDLKLRIGYGITGQQDGLGNYSFLSFYSLSQANAAYQFGNEFYQGYRPSGFNPALKWEQTKTSNIGLDFGFLDNRISGSIDVYYKKTKDLLNLIPQPAGTNFAAFIMANVGDMENKGIEFNLNLEPVRSSDISWTVNFNATYNKNKITNLTIVPDDPNYIGFPSGGIAGGVGGQNAQINAVGGPKNTFYLYKQVYDKNGLPLEGVFVDKNNDGIINQDDLYKGESSDPKVFMGFSTEFRYKKWNIGAVLRANFDNYVYNNTYSQLGTLDQILGSPVLYNASVNYLRTNFVGNSLELLSDYYLQNASFLRMDNLNVAYMLGKAFKEKVAVRINGTIQNVFVITKYKGLDPEIGSGIDNNLYPRPRIYSLGLNLDF